MDKTESAFLYSRYRQGFALVITLSVLSIIMALTMVLLGYFKKVKHDASDTKAMIQADVYYADILEVFSKFKKKKTLFSTLYRQGVPLHTKDGRFTMNLNCKPLSNGININWLSMENKTDMQEAYSFAQTIFEMLVQDYDIKDANRLQEMLLEEIGGKKKFVKKEYSRLRQKNGIISYKQFSDVLSAYQVEVDDAHVTKVPWRKYFTFSRDAKKIDAEYSSPELISVLFDLDIQSVREWYNDPKKSALQTFVQSNGGNYASRNKIIIGKGFLSESACTVSFKSSGNQYKFRFEYIKGAAKHFEFYK